MNLEIFKAYDIRGVYPEDINKEVAFKIGRGLVTLLSQNSKKRKKVLLGRDNRLSSSLLLKAIKEGINKQGADVIDIGIATTPMFYFAAKHFRTDGGAMITASHNPPEYNGFKIIKEKAANIGKGQGMETLRNIVKGNNFSTVKYTGKSEKRNIMPDYLKMNFNFVKAKGIAPLRLVIDTANATASPIIPYIKKKIPQLRIYHLFSKLDGRFPNHNPDPTIESNLLPLINEVKKRKADFGIAFDGDADRIVFIDEKGKKIDGDLLTAFIAKTILTTNKGAKILADISSSKIVEDVVRESKGKFCLSRTGHSFIKPKMVKEGICFGGEKSGHYYLGANSSFETPLFVLFKVLSEVSKSKGKFSDLFKPFEKYINSGEINFQIKEKKEALSKIEKIFLQKKLRLSKIDGLKAVGKDFWCLIRPSNTEPLLRLIVEAQNSKLLEEKVVEMKKVIKEAGV
jgi:phosphomannomutase